MTDTLEQALLDAYWCSRANSGCMAKAALDALHLPRSSPEYGAPIERCIDRWLMGNASVASFGAIAQDVRRVAGKARVA